MSIIVIILFLSISSSSVLSQESDTIKLEIFPSFKINTDNTSVTIDLELNNISYGHELLWRAHTTGTNYEESAVVYVDSIAYIGSCSTHGDGYDRLFAVDTSNGDILWSSFTGPGYVGPVIDGDLVYFGTDSHGHYPDDEYFIVFGPV